MAEETPAEQTIKWDDVGAQFGAGLVQSLQAKGIEHDIINVLLRRDGAVQALMFDLLVVVAQKVGQSLKTLEEPFLPIIAELVAPILGGLFGAEIDSGMLQRKFARGGGTSGANMIVDGFMRAIVGDTPAEIQPTDAGAKRIAAAAVTASLESSFNALVPQLISDLFPEGVGHFETLSQLPEDIIRALGVSRLVRGALRPIVTTCCTTPATWHMNKLHRPTLLGASTLAKQIARNPEKREAWLEDLRRDGYSEDRIEALLNEQAKFHSVADVALLIRTGQWALDEGVQHLKDQGYSDDAANGELLVEKLKIIAAFERAIAGDAVTAFGNGNIDEGTLGGMVTGATISTQEKAQFVEHAHAKRILNRRALTPGEAKDAVKAGVLAYPDYRRALERDGRDDDAVIVLELLLRKEIDDKHTIEEHRAQLDAERAAEKAKRDADAIAKKTAADARLALSRRGSMSALEAAYVRGLIPLERVQEVYDATYDGDTAGVLSDLVQSKRADYVAQQAAAEKARILAATRGVNVAELETAVQTGVLTLDQFRQRLADLHFTAADADLLTSTLDAKLQQKADAERVRADAAAAAKIRHVDLATFELLVRRGHRTMADYAALLASLNFDQAAIAALTDRLQILINDDADKAAQRAAAAAKLAAKGLSLDQYRRAVILGIKTIADYAQFLLAQGFGAADVQVLAAELQTDVDGAAAARQRRADAERRQQAGLAPLSDVRRAARLGLIPLAAYNARLTAAGYTDDDIAIESDLLATEIADDAARKAAADVAEQKAAHPGLTLTELAAAVKAGTAPIGDYTARALAIGLAPADADTLTATLQAAIDARDAAQRRKDELAAAGPVRELARADAAKAVKDGLRTLDDYQAWLLGAGYAEDDAALLVDELSADLTKGGAAGAGPVGG